MADRALPGRIFGNSEDGHPPWRCFVADCGLPELPELPGARRGLTQFCT